MILSKSIRKEIKEIPEVKYYDGEIDEEENR